MISYALAKELKEAGFPQWPSRGDTQAFVRQRIWIQYKENGMWDSGDREPLLELKNHHGRIKDDGTYSENPTNFKWPMFSFQKRYDWENHIYSPTLTELIEACGDDFESLTPYVPQKSWAATSGSGIECIGDSLEEAVAKLWIELNKKQ